MLTSDTDGLKALHRVLVKARFRARDGAGSDELAPLFDQAETLLSYLILAEEDMTELFGEQLPALGEFHPEFADIGEDYQSAKV